MEVLYLTYIFIELGRFHRLPCRLLIRFTLLEDREKVTKGRGVGAEREREREEAKEVKCTTSLVVFFPTANFNTNLLFFRSVAGVDVDPDLVHMEMQDTSGGMVLFFQCACMSGLSVNSILTHFLTDYTLLQSEYTYFL